MGLADRDYMKSKRWNREQRRRRVDACRWRGHAWEEYGTLSVRCQRCGLVGERGSPDPRARRVARRVRKTLKWVGVTVGLLLVGLVALALALPEDFGEEATQQAGASPNPRKPTGYQAMFVASITPRKAATPLCARYRAELSKHADYARRLLDETRGVSEPYAAADYVSRGMAWLSKDHAAILDRRIRALATRRLQRIVTRPRSITDAMVVSFAEDSLFLCKQLAEYREASILLKRLHTRSLRLAQLAEAKPWYPRGWDEWSENIAWRWIDNHECGEYLIGYCWAIQVVTRNGCPHGVEAELNITNGRGTAVDYTLDALARLRPGQIGKLDFVSVEEGYGKLTGEITEINCY